MSQQHAVGDRVGALRREVSTVRFALGVAVLAALGLALAFLQEPLVHEMLHNFRHVSGITCH